jgi:glucose 1-dehydrogenase
MARFEGKVALVTGAARGIGRGIALRLASEGADVIINDVANIELAHEAADEIRAMGRRALVVQASVADRPAVEAMFAQGIAEFGQIDIVVANAGMSIRELVVDAEWEHVQQTLSVTQFGVFHTCQLGAQQMVKQGNGGKIIIISSLHAEVAFARSAAYNMAKAAVNHLCQTMAIELAEHRINVNTINPGWIDTPGERKFATDADIEAGAQRLPWKRLGTPDDIAAATAFLASDEADYITGVSLRVDGGLKLGLK